MQEEGIHRRREAASGHCRKWHRGFAESHLGESPMRIRRVLDGPLNPGNHNSRHLRNESQQLPDQPASVREVIALPFLNGVFHGLDLKLYHYPKVG